MPRKRNDGPDKLLPLLASGLPFVVYLRTMAPTVYGLDSAELTTGAYVLGIVHAPGSPLFMLLGHAFTWLPFGDVGYRVNLLSACAAAGAAALVYVVALRLTGQRLLALATAWFLAFSYYFWVAAVAAELYALHACLLAALIWVALAWRDRQHAWQLCAFALLFGLGLGNHLSLSVLAPGFAWLLFSERPAIWQRPHWWIAAVACGLLGASVYLYLPLRSHTAPLNFAREFGVDAATWDGFWWMVGCRMFASRFFAVPLQRLPVELAEYVYRLWSNFVGLGCVLGVVGLVDDFPRRRAVHTGLLLMFFGHLAFMLTYDVGDKELMLLPTYLIWGLWIALGAEAAAQYVARRTHNRLVMPAGVLLLLMGAGNLVINFGYADISRDWSARQRGERILNRLPPHALYVGTWEDVPILEYLRLVEQQRPDVQTVNLFFVRRGHGKQLLAERGEAGRQVFTSAPGFFKGDAWGFEYDAGCDCYRIDQTERP